MKCTNFDSYMHVLLVLFLVGAGFHCQLRFTFFISPLVCVSLYSVSKQVDILQKFEGWFWLIHISSNCVSKTSKFCLRSASWEHWQFWFVNSSDANSPAGNCSNSEVCKEILERALMLAVWTVWFCNPASSISAN